MKANQEEEFVAFENKVDEVMQILNLMTADDTRSNREGIEMANKFLEIDKSEQKLEKVNIDNFLVKTNYDRTAINNEKPSSNPPSEPHSPQSQFAPETQNFMNIIEQDANRRAAERKQRETMAQEMRKMGNKSFRDGDVETAVSLYSRAIDMVRDSPILYNNRALSYIKLSLYKRAIIDCDFVLNKLDEKNLRAWLYRAKAYYLLDEMQLYEKSIVEAKKHNPKEFQYIERIVDEIERSNELYNDDEMVGGGKEKEHATTVDEEDK